MNSCSVIGVATGLAFAICATIPSFAAIVYLGSDSLHGNAAIDAVDYGYNIGADSVELDDTDPSVDLDAPNSVY
jgi:hypothetical protein